MARMHSQGRGRSDSTKPKNPSTDWVEYDKNEVIELVKKLRKNGKSPSHIGRTLRDQYGIPSVKEMTGNKIKRILKDEDMSPEIPEDLKKLLKKAERIKNHLDVDKKDFESERQLNLAEAKIRKLADYYKDRGELPEDWNYKRENLENLF